MDNLRLAILLVYAVGAGAVSLSGKEGEARQGGAMDKVSLVNNQEPGAWIVVSPGAPEVERHAARELQHYLKQMSGTELSLRDSPDPRGSNLLVGSAVPDGALDLSEAALGFDGYWIKTVGRDLLLAGRQPHSSLYAVYDLLERHLGCGFFEDGDQVPSRRTIELSPLNEVRKPRFAWRIYSVQMQYAYSGMHWWDWEQYRHFCDWLAKKRYNLWEPLRIVESIGFIPLAAAKLGIPMEQTSGQKQRLPLMSRVVRYARMLGIRSLFHANQYNQGMEGNQNAPGTYPYPDRAQLEEFVRRYAEKTGETIPVITYQWGGTNLPVLDPRHPATQRFITAVVEAYREQLGTDHLYCVDPPGEGGWSSSDLEEMNRITYAMVTELAKAFRAGDPEAVLCARPPFPYAPTYPAQEQAIQEAGITIVADFWLNVPGRLHQFLFPDTYYFWGKPWCTGMVAHCGKHTNPWGDMEVAIANAKALAADPQANHCLGFLVSSEINHRNLMMIDLFGELAWNPADVEREDYLRRWTARRYGPDLALELHSVTQAVADTLLSSYNMDLTNHPLYRDWQGGYLPGLTVTSVKRTLSYLPQLRQALETLLAAHQRLEKSPLYRFDVVDLGRTYLGALFNDRLARARKAFRAQDAAAFEEAAAAVVEILHFMARFTSAHEQFRLQTWDRWAARWEPVLPGYDNRLSNWIMFTRLISPTASMLDYMAEDLAELVEHYYRPRVELYLQRMREMLIAGQDISGNLNRPNRISDMAPPRGELQWSPYGVTTEPELTAGDTALAEKIIAAGTVSGQFPFHQGPVGPLLEELLDRYPVPQDLQQILAEPEPEVASFQTEKLEGNPGEVIRGFHTPGVVEQVRIPEELSYLVEVEEVYSGYNLRRGEVTGCKVHVSDWLSLTRQPNESSGPDQHPVAIFTFEARGQTWVLRYDPGSQTSPAGIEIDPAGR